MSKHPSEMTADELMGLRAVNSARGREVVFSFYNETGALWHVIPGLGEPWTRVYGGYDLDKRTLPYVIGPGFTGRRHGLNPP
jgi:hypothetical protein